MKLAGREYQPEYLLLAAFGVVVLAALLNVVIQSWAVPGVMRFVPLESSNYAFSSSLRSLWTASEPHVGRYFRDVVETDSAKARQSTLTKRAMNLRKDLENEKIRLYGPADLATLGIDPNGAAALAIAGDVVAFLSWEPLYVLPVLDEARLLDTAAKVLGKEKELEPEAAARVQKLGGAMRKFGDWYLMLPDASTAVLSQDYKLLAKAVSGSEANLKYFRSSDQAIRSFADMLAGRPGAWIKGSLDLGRTARPLRFVAGLDGRKISIGTSFSPPVGQSRQLQQALMPGTSSLESLRASMGDSNLTALIDDRGLPQYIDLLEGIAGDDARAFVEKKFPALWGELSKTRSVRRVSLAVGSDARGVPDVLLGVALEESEADKVVFAVQSTLRLQRDEQILKAAFLAREKAAAEPGRRVSPAVLEQEGLLSPERGALWARYRNVGGAHRPTPALAPADFVDASYVRASEGRSLRFILPPMTDDDFRYRLGGKDQHDPTSVKDLKGDRFRMCSMYLDGILWFGNDADTLERALRARAAPAGNTDLDDAIRSAGAGSRSKAVLFLQPRKLLEQALLHPNQRVSSNGRLVLSDLSHYRAILVSATADRPEQLQVNATFLLH